MPSRKRKQHTKVKEKKLSDDASSDHMTHTRDVISDSHVTKLIIKPTSRAMTRQKQLSESHEVEEDLQTQLWQLEDNVPFYDETSSDVHVTNPKRRKPSSRATVRLKRDRSESPEVDIHNTILQRPLDHEIMLTGRVSQSKQNSNVAKATVFLQNQTVNSQKPASGLIAPPNSDINLGKILKPERRKSAARAITLHKQAHSEDVGLNREEHKLPCHSEDQMPPSEDIILIDNGVPHDEAILSSSNPTQNNSKAVLKNKCHSGHQDVELEETIQSRFKKKFAEILKSLGNRKTVEAMGVDSVADTSISYRKRRNHGADVCEREKTEPSSNCQDYSTYSARKEQTGGNGKELERGRFQGKRKSDDNNEKEWKTMKRSAKKESSSNKDGEDSSIDYEMPIGPSSVCLMQSPCTKVQQPINSEGTSTITKYNRDGSIFKDTEASECMNMSIIEHKSLTGNTGFQTDTSATITGLPQTICQRSISIEVPSQNHGSTLKNTQNEGKDKIPDFPDDSSTKYMFDVEGLSMIVNNVDDERNPDPKVIPAQGCYTEIDSNYLDDCDALPSPSAELTYLLKNTEDTAFSVAEMFGETVEDRCIFDNVLHSNTTTVPKSSYVGENNNLYKEETRQYHDQIGPFSNNFDSSSLVSVDINNGLVENVDAKSRIEEENILQDLPSRIQSDLCQYPSNSLEVSNEPDENITSSSEASDATTLENLQPPNASRIDIKLHSSNTSRPYRVNTTPAINTEDQINIHFDELSRIVFNVANKIKRTEDCKKKWLKKISDTNLSKQCSVLMLKTKSYIQTHMSIASQINRVLIKTIGYYKFITFLFRKVSLMTHQTKNSCSIDRKCFLKVYYLVLQADSEFFQHVKQSSLAIVIDKIDSIMNIRYDSMVDDQATMDQYLNAAIGSSNYKRLQESYNSTSPLDVPIFPNETPQQCAQQILTLSYIQQDQYKSQLPVPPSMVNNDLRQYQRDYKHYLQHVGTLYCARMANQKAGGVKNQGTGGMVNQRANGMFNQGTNGMTNPGTNRLTNPGTNGMINQGTNGITIHGDTRITNQGAYGPTNHNSYGYCNQRTFGNNSDVTSYDQLGQQTYNTQPVMPPNVYDNQYHDSSYSSNISTQQYQANYSTSSDISDYHYSTTPYSAISPTSSDISRHQFGVRVYSRSSVSYDTSGYQYQSQSTCSVSSDGSEYHRQGSDSLYPYEEQQLYCSTSSMSSDVARHQYQGHQMQSPVEMKSVGSYDEGMMPTTIMDIGCHVQEKQRTSKVNYRRRKSYRNSVDSGIDQELASPAPRTGSYSDVQEVPESVLFVQKSFGY